MQIRPATTFDLSDKSRICLLDPRDAPHHELEAIRQHIRNMQPYMIAQHMTVSTMSHSVRCANNKRTRVFISCSICSVAHRNRILLGTPVWVFGPFCLDSSDRLQKQEAAVESAIARFQRTGSVRRWDGTFFTTWTTPLIGTLKLCQTFQTEAAIDLARDQDRVLREHFPQVSRSHREEILQPELEEIYEPRHLEQEEDEDDETESARALSEQEKRELFRQHRNLGHPQPTELARARQEAIRFGLKELRCPTCEARPLLLPHRP